MGGPGAGGACGWPVSPARAQGAHPALHCGKEATRLENPVFLFFLRFSVNVPFGVGKQYRAFIFVKILQSCVFPTYRNLQFYLPTIFS